MKKLLNTTNVEKFKNACPAIYWTIAKKWLLRHLLGRLVEWEDLDGCGSVTFRFQLSVAKSQRARQQEHKASFCCSHSTASATLAPLTRWIHS